MSLSDWLEPSRRWGKCDWEPLPPQELARGPRRCRMSVSERTMATAEERLMEWLRDAHAAEEQAETMLSGVAGRIENYPQLKARLEQHLQETKRHAELVRGCIERRGGSTSMIKDAGAKMIAMGQAMSGMFVGDEVMKGTIANAAFEAMEISSYRILIATAEQ